MGVAMNAERSGKMARTMGVAMNAERSGKGGGDTGGLPPTGVAGWGAGLSMSALQCGR
jgi:hypothetical protein